MLILWLAAMAAALWVIATFPAHAHDAMHPELNKWYHDLMQPDNPGMSCCGEADAYWCDDVHVVDGKTYCAITDEREVTGRPHLDVGTRFEIPPNKIKTNQGNPTGHEVIFLTTAGHVWCFVQGTRI